MAEAWPDTLPCAFVRGTMSRALGENTLRSEMEVGPAKQRPRATSAPQPLSGTMKMDTAQLQAFTAFYRTTLLEGSLPFTFPVFGENGVHQLCRFTKAPSWKDSAPNRWMVGLDLEILP